jgi:hypothetical protein
MAALSWPEVADRFNASNGTHLTHVRIAQIGNAALAKLAAAAPEIIGTFEDNYYDRDDDGRDLERRLYQRDVRQAEAG